MVEERQSMRSFSGWCLLRALLTSGDTMRLRIAPIESCAVE